MTQGQCSQHWSQYWASGNLTSLPQDFASNYDGEIARFWRTQFSHVPDHGKMLDLCTGNGAILLLAAAWSRSESVSVELFGVDAAQINSRAIMEKFPGHAHLLSSLKLLSKCRVEDIDLPPANFDLITSQYGIEYCDWPRAAAQVFRLLKPGGRFAFLSHAVSTDIIRYMEDEWREYEVLAELKFLSGIEQYVRGDLTFLNFQKVMKNSQAALSGQYPESQFMAAILNMLASVVPMDEATVMQNRTRLDQFQREISHGRERLKDLLRVNRAIQSDPGWYRVFEQHGLELVDEGDILYKGVHNSGRCYCFVKPVLSAKDTTAAGVFNG